MNMIKSHGAPTDLTVGQLGQRYLDLDTDKKYVCVDIQRAEDIGDGPSIHDSFVHTKEFVANGNLYLWEELASAGGSGEATPDMVVEFDVTDEGPSSSNGTIVEGGISNIDAKLRDGKKPVVKVRIVSGSYGDTYHYRLEFEASCSIYGENYHLIAMVHEHSSRALAKLYISINADQNITKVLCYTFAEES